MTEDRLEFIRNRIVDFPKTPGVYLMKDAEGRVLYIGKAKDLRARAASYFQPGADLLNTRGPDICRMVDKVHDLDFLECETEVDAILKEARLIKDIQPPHNVLLRDDKTFPYIEITTADDFPGVFVTRTPRLKGSKLYGPFPSAGAIRDAVNALQKVFKFRTCELDIAADDPSRRFFRPCLLHAINQCTAPCADFITKMEYKKDIDRLKKLMASKRSVVLRQMTQEMQEAAQELRFEDAAVLRDRVKAIQALSLSGDVDEDVQPEVFYVDPRAGLEKLAELLNMDAPPRSMECIDIAHLQGSEMVGSLVCFIDGKPFKNGYRRFKIKNVPSIDDYAAIKEVITRRYRYAAGGEELYPDVILIDGGLGQLHAGLDAFQNFGASPTATSCGTAAPGGVCGTGFQPVQPADSGAAGNLPASANQPAADPSLCGTAAPGGVCGAGFQPVQPVDPSLCGTGFQPVQPAADSTPRDPSESRPSGSGLQRDDSELSRCQSDSQSGSPHDDPDTTQYLPCDDEGRPIPDQVHPPDVHDAYACDADHLDSLNVDADDLDTPAVDPDDFAQPFTPLQPPMVISLAKREEELYIQARSAPIRLSRNNPALRLLQQMRDEAHRFAQHYHHILRKKSTFDENVRQGRRPPHRKSSD